MKRSKMIDCIVDKISGAGKPGGHDYLEAAEAVLNMIEKKGMLPPVRKLLPIELNKKKSIFN